MIDEFGNKIILGSSWRAIMHLKDVDEAFDLICATFYFAGQFNIKMPVSQARHAFGRIKKLLFLSK